MTATPESICAASGSSVLSLVPNTGYGAGSIQWQDSPNGTVYTDIAGATNTSYSTPVLTSTTYYKALIKDGLGNICLQPSASVSVGLPSITGTVPATCRRSGGDAHRAAVHRGAERAARRHRRASARLS